MDNNFRPNYKGKNGKRKDGEEAVEIELPNDANSEIRVIGTVLKDNDAFDEVSFLDPRDFFDPLRSAIWGAIKVRLNKGEHASPILLAATFPTADGDNDTVLKACNAACTLAVSRVLLGSYAKTVADLAENRAAHSIATAWAQKALDPSKRECLDGLRSAVDAVSETKGEEDDDDAAWEAVAERAFELYRTQGATKEGVRTLIPALDSIAPSFRDGNFILLAGVPGHGKTTLALQIALNNALSGIPVLFFTLEMSKAEIMQKLASMLSGVEEDLIELGSATEDQTRAYAKAAATLQASPLKVIRKLPLKPGALFSTARRWHRKTGEGRKLIVVDYLGKMAPEDRTNGVYERMSSLSNDMKNVAGMLGLPILTLAQLNRDIFKRANKKPQNSDLRDSGNLEADADMIFFVQKVQGMLELDEPVAGSDDFEAKHAVWLDKYAAAAGQTMVYLTKSRRTGKTGTVELKHRNCGFSTDMLKAPLEFNQRRSH